MQYAILCYHSEDVVGSWTKEEDDAVMARLAAVQEPLLKKGKLGPLRACCRPRRRPRCARTQPELVMDGPYAETKEQLLGFYIVDCESLDEAIGIARDLGRANPGGAYEIRPVGVFSAGGAMT